jgi:hypothetical protein
MAQIHRKKPNPFCFKLSQSIGQSKGDEVVKRHTLTSSQLVSQYCIPYQIPFV